MQRNGYIRMTPRNSQGISGEEWNSPVHFPTRLEASPLRRNRACSGFVCGNAAQIAATGLDPCQANPGQTTSPPSCAQESAILITLPPGAYTAILSGVGGGTGVGLVEAFKMD